jgi:hypothetical protein
MKKIYALLFLTTATLYAMAQGGHAPMKFSGKATIEVKGTTVSTLESDTVMYSGSDVTLPEMRYGTSVIPSFTIHGAQFSMDMSTMTVTFPEQEFNETITVDGVEKTIVGTSLTGSYAHDAFNTFKIKAVFKYGTMPMPLTYDIVAYYIKDYTDKLDVSIGGVFNYTAANVTYSVRTYPEGDNTLLDVKVPSYELSGTPLGELSVGGYIVKGLAMDAEKGGYYRDYAADGLTMHFKSVNNGETGMDGDYALSQGDNNILLVYEGKKIKVTNAFHPGAMPMQIVSQFPGEGDVSAVEAVKTVEKNDMPAYNLAGQRTAAGYKGIIIKGGKKYFQR